MWILVAVVAVTCLLAFLAQFVGAWRYARKFRSDEADRRVELEQWPKFYVFMPLRGPDPHLPEAIRAILEQDYPAVELRIIVDDDSDPAMQLVEDTLRDLPATNVRVETLRVRLDTCSLVCSSIVQFFDDLDEECGLFTLIPADVIAPPNWLRAMAGVMADPQIGTTLGNRWYQPVEGRWGSLLRYCWNAGAVVPMWMLEIPWGGAWALRPKDVRRAGFDQKWQHAMAEDAPLKTGLRKLGLGLGFDPQLIVANHEETSVAGCFHFVKRQMLWTRLYHPNWSKVLVGSTLGAAAMFLPAVAAVVAAALQSWAAVGVLAGVFLTYLLGQLSMLMLLERAVGGMLHRRGEPTMTVTPWLLLRLLLAIPFTQILYMASIADCVLRRELTWRGIRYVVKGPWNAVMTGHTPYRSTVQQDAGANVSLQ